VEDRVVNDSCVSNSKKVTNSRSAGAKPAHDLRQDSSDFGSESDIVSFWLLLLFIAVFVGIATEEKQGTLFTSSTRAAHAPVTDSNGRDRAAREFDLTSRSRPEKTEVPATGK
jgi:hypothetical protein